MAYVAQIVPVRPNMSGTRTYHDFSRFLGEKPKRLGIVATMYKNLTATYLTEGLGNIFYNGQKSPRFQNLNSMSFEWEISVDFIKRLRILALECQGLEYKIAFPERYYEKYDTFQFIDTKQQAIVLAAPIRKADNYWEYFVQILDTTGDEALDPSLVGTETRFLTNIQPELHEEGHTKYQSNIQKHRGWISEIRHDQDWSARYARMEDVFIKISEGEGGGEAFFKLPKIKSDLIQHFMESRNNTLLLGKSTMDANGKCRVHDPQTGRELISGDGIIPQINRFASMFSYNKLSVSILNRVIKTMVLKSEHSQGNEYVVTCNTELYSQIQEVLAKQLMSWTPVTADVYSKKGEKLIVGAEFAGYRVMGNTISFAIDRNLDIEYPTTGYGVFIDLTADKTSGQPAVAMFTLDGKEYIESTFNGVENSSCAA